MSGSLHLSSPGLHGSAYAHLASIVERKKASLLAVRQEGTQESMSRVEAEALGVVAVGRLYKRVEPRLQF